MICKNNWISGQAHNEYERVELTAFYDLEVAPISFDFSVFLVLAENQRRQLEAESLRVVIAPVGRRLSPRRRRL